MANYDVPREKWLYPDRGMMKFMGFFMSDHTVYMEDQSKVETPILPRSVQTDVQIRQLLAQAYLESRQVNIQLASYHDGQLLPDIVGNIIGYNQDQIVLSDSQDTIRQLEITAIRNLQLADTSKWYERSFK